MAANEPIAIIGMACRFPGAEDYDAYWRLLASGTMVRTEGMIGSGSPGRMGQFLELPPTQSDTTHYAAFIEDIDKFDAEFFRISPVEAQLLDPQQRLMLETSWRALEDAGIDPESLRGTRTGVYGGISNAEYRYAAIASIEADDPATSLYAASGSSLNTAIGRVSYALGLEGPAISIDTACSSSLVAMHQAVIALNRGEANLALAGGVNAILSARVMNLRRQAGMLSPNGVCRTFDEAADGYLRGEGCGVLVLKRLSDAERDGDRIWGVIRGSAINQDGASQGITVPSASSQENVIRDALSSAGLTPVDVDYLEAHGTATPVGDPAELSAATAAYGNQRPADQPMFIGSVKTNFGHLEPASGAAGVMKVVLGMRRGVIPKHLNFENPTTAIDWENANLRVPTEATEWPKVDGRPPRAGVSGFGWSGTNAHIIVEGYGAPASAPASRAATMWPVGAAVEVETQLSDDTADVTQRPTRLLPLSARSPESLQELAERYLNALDETSGGPPPETAASDPALSDMSWTASIGRSHFRYRAAIPFREAASLRDGLSNLIESTPQSPVGSPARIGFVYTGQGSQWVGMAQALYETEPVARDVLDRCDRIIKKERGVSLLDVMFGKADDLDDSRWAMPTIYAVECALTALWKSIGVTPAVVAGHSLGEYAAAQAAGVFTLEEGIRLTAARGELMSGLPLGAAMGVVFAPEAAVQEAIAEQQQVSGDNRLTIAVDNGINHVVSGPEPDVEAVLEKFEAKEVRVRRMPPSPAFHSSLLEPMLEPLGERVREIVKEPRAPQIEFICGATGKPVDPDVPIDAAYWMRHSREKVLYRTSVESLAELGVDFVIEIGPGAVIGAIVSMCWPPGAPAKDPPVIASMVRPPHDETEPPIDQTRGFISAVKAAYEAGLSIDFRDLYAGETRRRVPVPEYPFQRYRHWVEEPRRQRASTDHPLLGTRHESPRGEIYFETELLPDDPAWLSDHRVYGRVIAPGALYGVMAVEAFRAEESGGVVIDDMQMQAPLLFSEADEESSPDDSARAVQIMVQAPDDSGAREFEIYSKGSGEESWTLHARGTLSSATDNTDAAERVTIDDLKAGLESLDISEFYRAKREANLDFGPLFRTVDSAFTGNGMAVGEVSLPEGLSNTGLAVHPILLDACLQVVSAARATHETASGTTYLPFAWDRLWLSGGLPERVVCRATLRAANQADASGARTVPEVIAADLEIYSTEGERLGGITGFTAKRASRDSVLSTEESVQDLLYDIVWEDCPLPPVQPADFLPEPSSIQATTPAFAEYLSQEGVDWSDRTALLRDLERLSWSFALDTLTKLGWQQTAGAVIEPETLRRELGVTDEHSKLFRRILELLARAGVLQESGDAFHVLVGPEDSLPGELPTDPDAFAAEMLERYPHGSIEVALCRRAAGELADILRGQADPLTVLFGSGDPTPADIFIRTPASRAVNNMLRDTIAALLENLPETRTLRIVEVGAGTGSATMSVLPQLPEGRFEYVYTDISAGFFAEAESQFGTADGAITYMPLNIELDPAEQGFDAHGYDLVIASNVLHDTISLSETLQNCLTLLAPSGHLVAIESIQGQGWQDVTFGTLDGWWRFADHYRPNHGVAGADVWEQALLDTAFEDPQVLGLRTSDSSERPDRAVIIAAAPAEIVEQPGSWVLAADDDGMADELAAELASRSQLVLVVTEKGAGAPHEDGSVDGVSRIAVDRGDREAWGSIFASLPEDVPLRGVVHLAATSGNGSDIDADGLADDIRRVGSSALAMVQGLLDSNSEPKSGAWLVTRGAQDTRREQFTQPAGAILWGFGRVIIRELADLQPKVVDLDGDSPRLADLVDELLRPDGENHIALRSGYRLVARLARTDDVPERLTLPDEGQWFLMPDETGDPGRVHPQPESHRELETHEVRVAMEAVGVNFRDVLISIGIEREDNLGLEFVGKIIEIGDGVSSVSVGDRVAGIGFSTFGPEIITKEALVASAPPNISKTGLGSAPTAFVTVALSYDLARLQAGDTVLIHAGSGGVGLAAIEMAKAVGAEIYTTASIGKQPYLRSLGITHVYNSRSTEFAEEILRDTGGKGVDVVLNSLTGEGFIDASLSCLAQNGRFIELAREGILTEEEMAEQRPDVDYHIIMLDRLKREEPEIPGAALKTVLRDMEAGTLAPIPHTRWSLSEAPAAITYMRDTRHIGKIALANSPLQTERLREDGTYLITGGLGGIGITVARWLADKGAGAIVLNGRRDPDPEAQDAIDELRARGVTVQVEIADVTDSTAIDAMLTRIDQSLPPLAGVIHSVGVLSDGVVGNQTWERFEQILRPKVLGAWHLHRATMDRDLDLFVLFSSAAGILGNPGQSNHAAANTFLDQLVRHRRALGLTGQAIAWGAWSEVGEAEEQRERIGELLAERGSRWITPERGIETLEFLIKQDWTNSVAVAIDWESIRSNMQNPPAMLQRFTAADESDSASAGDSMDDLPARLSGVPLEQRESVFTEFLQHELQAIMRMPSQPNPGAEFSDLGMDSLMAVALRNNINSALKGLYVAPNTVVFDYPSITRLAVYLAEEVGEPGAAAGSTTTVAAADERTPESPPRPRPGDDAIAIVGMACRFPGSENLDAFWRLLENGESAVTDGRTDGGDYRGVFGDPAAQNTYERLGAFLDHIDEFDARFFRIAPIEARTMDPQQRLLLETAWQALEDAGIDPDALRGSQTGVYAGISGSEYRSVLAMNGGQDIFGTIPSMAVGRIAFTFGLQGPAVPIDLACTSSLAAVHQGVVSLQRGEVDLALAGGVNIALSQSTSTFLAELGVLSLSGKTASFDASGDGYVRGEGCGFVILKRLGDAERDGDRIWGVVRGSAVNQNGAGFSFTSPNGVAQEKVMREALERSGISASDVDYLEAHGTGTPLGDSIEANAIANVYGKDRPGDQPLTLGSVKTNVGHLEAASGMASLIKVVLSMNRNLIPRHLHFSTPSPEIDWKKMPLQIALDAEEWPGNGARAPIAGINTFGMTGANAHVIVEGYTAENGLNPDDLQATTKPPARLLPLSAKNPAALSDLAASYLEWLDNGGQDGASTADMLADMAWTASIGRSHFTHRACVIFRDQDELRSGLERLVDAGSPSGDTGQETGTRDSESAAVDSTGDTDSGTVDAMARAYEAGHDVDFSRLFTGEERRKIRLPGYPFQRRRFWVEKKAVKR